MRILIAGILVIASLFPSSLLASPGGQIEEYLEACRKIIHMSPDQFVSLEQDELLRHLLMALVCSEPEISSRLEEPERKRILELTKRFKEIKKNLPANKLEAVEKWEEYFKIKYEEEMGKARLYVGEELSLLDVHLKSIWKEMLDALRRKDVNRAVTYFAKKTRGSYRDLFSAIKEKLPEVARGLEDIKLIEMRTSRDVQYDIQSLKDGKRYSHPLIFIKEKDDEWRILEF